MCVRYIYIDKLSIQLKGFQRGIKNMTPFVFDMEDKFQASILPSTFTLSIKIGIICTWYKLVDK